MGLVDILIGPITAILDKVIPDKDAREKMAFEIATLAANQAHAEVMAQIEINKAEATNPSVFVSGWRPFIGWCCGFSIAFNFIVVPLCNWGTALAGYDIMVPVLDMSVMMPVILGMLGLIAARTKEKIEGVARVN